MLNYDVLVLILSFLGEEAFSVRTVNWAFHAAYWGAFNVREIILRNSTIAFDMFEGAMIIDDHLIVSAIKNQNFHIFKRIAHFPLSRGVLMAAARLSIPFVLSILSHQEISDDDRRSMMCVASYYQNHDVVESLITDSSYQMILFGIQYTMDETTFAHLVSLPIMSSAFDKIIEMVMLTDKHRFIYYLNRVKWVKKHIDYSCVRKYLNYMVQHKAYPLLIWDTLDTSRYGKDELYHYYLRMYLLASKRGRLDIVKTVLKAKLFCPGIHHEYALRKAIQFNHDELIDFLTTSSCLNRQIANPF